MNFIKKMFDENFDEAVHLQFQKFSRGEFKNRAIIKAKFSSGKYTINTSAEFANELVRDLAKKLADKKTIVTGGIISTVNLKEIPKYHNLLAHTNVKQFQGVKNYQINLELSGNEIIDIIDAFPKAFFALSFSTGENVLKIKPKAPKSGKPGTKGEGIPKPDFCKLITPDKKIAEDFIFENPNFKEARVVHDFFVENIEIPQELKNSKDFALIREKSKRVGKILRKANIDGKEIKEEFNFKA